MGEVVQVDDGSQLVRQSVLAGGGLVGGEHDVVALEAAFVGEHQLCKGGAVYPAAFLLKDLQNAGGGRCLYGKVLLEAGIPGKGGFQIPGCLANAHFIIEMKWGGVLSGNGLKLGKGDKGGLHRGKPRFSLYFPYHSTREGRLSTESFYGENTKIKKEKNSS